MNRLKRTLLLGAALATGVCGNASAQSPPNPAFYYGFVPTFTQWNGFFQAKQDYLGFTPVNPNNLVGVAPVTATMSGTTISLGFNFANNNTWLGVNTFAPMRIAVSGTAGANFNLGCPSIGPSAPNNGDTWCTGSGLFIRAGGVTIGPMGSAASFLAASNVWTGTNNYQNTLTVSGTLAAPLQIGAGGTVGWFRAGLTLGSPTGGDQGSGTSNVAVNYYVNAAQMFPAIGTQTTYYNSMGGSALPTGQTITAVFDNYLGNGQGNFIYRNATTWVSLAAGTSGYALSSGGPSGNLSWVNQSSGGTMNQITITGVSGVTAAGVSGGGCSNVASIGCQLSAPFIASMVR